VAFTIGGVMSWQSARARYLERDLHLIFALYACLGLVFPQFNGLSGGVERLGLACSLIAPALPAFRPLGSHWPGQERSGAAQLNLLAGRWLLGLGVGGLFLGIISET